MSIARSVSRNLPSSQSYHLFCRRPMQYTNCRLSSPSQHWSLQKCSELRTKVNSNFFLNNCHNSAEIYILLNVFKLEKKELTRIYICSYYPSSTLQMFTGIYGGFMGKSECGDFKFMGIACYPQSL